MARKQDRPKAEETIEPSVTEISVTENGFLKPYLSCFQYAPDNISKEPLGILAGVFSIGDRSEDSAYIVNFLASLAKKEYYANARRNAVESFETALHKANIGLSELVKEGNAHWVGTLDAALCVFERNNLHFSVAGNASVILIRNGHLVDASEGLADTDEHHPLKTFTEVSSGKLRPKDRILITTPELFSILTSNELERASNRLDNEAFSQFLRTAIVNRLDCSGTLVIHIQKTARPEKNTLKKSAPLASAEYVPNAWSLSAFSAAKKQTSDKNLSTNREEPPKERIDDKTGHIYVTGDTPNEQTNERWESFRIRMSDFRSAAAKNSKRIALLTFRTLSAGMHSFASATQKGFHTMMIAVAAWKKARTERKITEAKQKQGEIPEMLASPTKSDEEKLPNPALKTEIAENQSVRDETPVNISSDPTPSLEELPENNQEKPEETPHLTLTPNSSKVFAEPSPLRNKLSAFYQKQTDTPHEAPTDTLNHSSSAQNILSRFSSSLRNTSNHVFVLWKSFSQKGKMAAIGIPAALIGTITLFSIHTSSTTSSGTEIPEIPSVESATDEVPVASDTTTQHRVHDPEIILSATEPLVGVVFLGETAYGVSKQSITPLGNTSESIALPDGKIAAKTTAMPNLNTLFILTESGLLLSYTPSNQKFSESTIDLPHTTDITGLGAYLTYLYVLDTKDGALYRYPRAEGGFGSKTNWMKEGNTIPFGATFSVGEFIAIANGTNLNTFERGTRTNIPFENPESAISYDRIFIASDNTLFALDTKDGRIVSYNQSGNILAEYENDAFKNATDLTVNPNTKTAYLISGSDVLSVTLE